ncbi:hypothetical protein EXIGLDRAFT_416924 [Exidia glandulosa HHB12029]|uniref:Spc7 kinetochore protein domain-containing protein n=1 Tax=Exidia glandulosa HHB12029 TaxID=1314781 RepID=A0A165PST1_EXIGL|nr:hypothetical protein EXIGLDRAFT_416924 [Exidia glandulosa HHB12029]
MTMDEFFAVTGIKFMDEFTCPRYSTALGLMNAPPENDDQVYELEQYFKALAVDVQQLETYQWTTNFLQGWLATSKANYAEAEQNVLSNPPAIFQAFVFADEEQRASMMHQLKIIKTNSLALAKAEWYAWKSDWIADLRSKADVCLAELDEDEGKLRDAARRVNDRLPEIRAMRDRVMRELAEERATVAEIETCDQDHLASLKAEIDVQAAEIERQKNEVADQETTVAHMHEKLAEQEHERREVISAIEDADRQSAHQRGCTREGLHAQLDELDAMQALHGWRIARLSPALVELVYADKFTVRIPCREWDALGVEVDVVHGAEGKMKKPGWRKDKYPDATAFMLQALQRQATARIRAHRRYSYGQVVRYIDTMWHAFACVRREIDLLAVRFPVQVTTDTASASLRIAANILVEKLESKAVASFVFNDDALLQWPLSVENVRVDAVIKYGDIQRDDVRMAVQERLVHTKPTDHYGHLLECCLEVVARYD